MMKTNDKQRILSARENRQGWDAKKDER